LSICFSFVKVSRRPACTPYAKHCSALYQLSYTPTRLSICFSFVKVSRRPACTPYAKHCGQVYLLELYSRKIGIKIVYPISKKENPFINEGVKNINVDQ
jgi:hypothetical protein